MTYSLSMKNLLVLLVVTLAATGCRTTHEADAEELANLGEVDGTLQTGESPADDFGQFSLGAFSSIQPALRYLSNKERNNGQADAAIVQSPEELEALRLVSFVSDGSRDEWPACLTELENGVIYDNCVLGVEVPSVSIGFTADGEYSWTDNSSTSDLFMDFGASVAGFGIGTSLSWIHDMEWTDTKLDGSFDLDWATGVMLGGSPSLTSVQFGLTGTIEGLETDSICDGPVSGVLDWRARYREGLNPVEITRVTVEFTGCDSALVTW